MDTLALDDCEALFNRALSCKTEAAFCHAIDPLFHEYEILSLALGRGSIFWRARVIEKDVYPNISDLDYPPANFAKQGRLNDKGIPCFYIAARKETAIAEVGATEGQLVQLAGFRIKSESPIRLVVIGEYANVQKNGYMHFAGSDPDMTIARTLNSMPHKEALKKIYIDNFFASVLADPNASENGYLFSRALGQAIYSRNNSQGIVFPSVKDRGGFNLAIQAAPSDESFHNVCCIVARSGKPRLFGLIDFSVVKSAERLDEDWNFIWQRENNSKSMGMYNLSKEEFGMLSQNPTDG
ncbi:RES family NAD+ phosphorylase [Pseudomonas chlororaphis]|uniref:RES family NAD+ phosphorylase n=1 Tax=Pseudomonas chlororaphis TaxID=587753 RepID=UPI0023688F93|nr:RES family NAD+ phosphorylase [Pseudomonas chlororaphis]WDH50930.1 RES family NAD+ phosphorylase [Pseudomonas chlororaphis]